MQRGCRLYFTADGQEISFPVYKTIRIPAKLTAQVPEHAHNYLIVTHLPPEQAVTTIKNALLEQEN